MLMKLEARFQTSATLFNFGNRYATYPSDEKGRESIPAAVPKWFSRTAFFTLRTYFCYCLSFQYAAHNFKYCSEQAVKTCYFGIMLSALQSTVVTVSNVTETL
jgi:hypothetical protein